MLRMVLEALQAGEQRRGTSVMAIKVYILQKYPTVDAIRLKYLLKRALDTGLQRGLLVRPTNSKAKGATGSFKVSLVGSGGSRWKDSAPGLELQFSLSLPGLCVLFCWKAFLPVFSSCSACVFSETLSSRKPGVCAPSESPHGSGHPAVSTFILAGCVQ